MAESEKIANRMTEQVRNYTFTLGWRLKSAATMFFQAIGG